MQKIQQFDQELFQTMNQEKLRQEHNLELIASENIVSRAVLEAAGSVLTNKYAEGYPGKRYYGGCEFVDKVEELAQERAKILFQADYANVQPHSGSQANMGVYFSFIKPGDTILGMDLAQGGHLTHGSPANFSGKLYKVVSYGVDRDTELVNYDTVAHLARQHKPKIIIAGFSSYSRVLDFQKFREIADEVGALLLTDMAHVAGLVAAGVYPSPVHHSHITTTTTHKTLRGPRGGLVLVGKDGENTMGVIVPKTGRKKTWSEILDSTVFPGIQGGPLMHIIAAKAVAFKEAMSPSFVEYQKQVVANAKELAKHLQNGGARVVSGGTDNHLFCLDLTPLGVTGKDAQEWLDQAHITVNKNAIPFDQLSPSVASGIRIGTPAITTRGMKEPEMEQIAQFILDVLKSKGDFGVQKNVGEEVKKLCSKFPLDPIIN
jgi:glycine hydroxymethyltransferase